MQAKVRADSSALPYSCLDLLNADPTSRRRAGLYWLSQEAQREVASNPGSGKEAVLPAPALCSFCLGENCQILGPKSVRA